MSTHSTAPAPAHRDAWMPPPPPSGMRPVIDVGDVMAENGRLRAEVAENRKRIAALEAQIEEMTRPTLPDGSAT